MRKKSMRELQALGEEARARSRVAQERQQAKRAQRSAQPQALAEKKVDIDFGSMGDLPARVCNSSDVQRWWRDAIQEQFPGVEVAAFLVRDQALAKKLLGEFGAARVERGIQEFVIGWQDRYTVQGEFHPAVPLFTHLWRLRQDVFGGGQAHQPERRSRPNHQMQQAEHLRHKGEWNPDEAKVGTGSGWGDVE